MKQRQKNKTYTKQMKIRQKTNKTKKQKDNKHMKTEKTAEKQTKKQIQEKIIKQSKKLNKEKTIFYVQCILDQTIITSALHTYGLFFFFFKVKAN